MAKKKTTNKPLTQKELKAMLAETKATEKSTKSALTQLESAYKELTTPSAAAEIPAELTRSRVTGLSPVQQAAQKDLLNVAAEQGGGYLRTAKSAGQVVPKPETVLPVGQEWKWFPTTGGGGSWRAVQVFDPNARTGGFNNNLGGGNQDTAEEELAAKQAAQLAAEEKRRAGQSAYTLLFEQFQQYGLGALVEPLKGFIVDGLSPAEFTLRLRDTDAYKKRFAANAARIQKGLSALSEAEYIQLEDQYQNVMRNYGLPESYYTRGDMGRQEGFEKFIGNDVSAAELEDRIVTAQNRVINAAPEVSKALREFYPDITNGDILAYALDPQQALTNIKRKVTAAEIGAGAMQSGLKTALTRAEELQRFGVTGEQARTGYQTIADVLPTASKLGDIYSKQGMGAYDQATAEQEVFGITGAAQAAQKRRRLAQLETAQFSGTSGAAGGALGRERAGQF